MKTFNPSTFFRLVTGVTSALLLCACASTSRVDLNSKGPERTYQVVNVMSASDQAGDVSAALASLTAPSTPAHTQRHGCVRVTQILEHTLKL